MSWSWLTGALALHEVSDCKSIDHYIKQSQRTRHHFKNCTFSNYPWQSLDALYCMIPDLVVLWYTTAMA
ncbi:hypothetical protein O6P43_026462 [Quillaja saponaria]|uniref:Uncharacterized protein n=1 Tax=Quillaja saponaria TaxID=32244 RepID=A0AAD7PC68_QUISA|nr:hypothetical protein O6P43_026462 [Quillaja saponaria]